MADKEESIDTVLESIDQYAHFHPLIETNLSYNAVDALKTAQKEIRDIKMQLLHLKRKQQNKNRDFIVNIDNNDHVREAWNHFITLYILVYGEAPNISAECIKSLSEYNQVAKSLDQASSFNDDF